MHGKVVLALGIDDLIDGTFGEDRKGSGIADLSAHLTIEGSSVEDNLIEDLALLLDFAITEDAGLTLVFIVSDKTLFALSHTHPVTVLYGSSIAGTLLLLLHLHAEAFLVDRKAMFRTDELRKVEGESVSVEEGEYLFACHHGAALALGFGNDALKEADTGGKGAEERLLFFTDNLGDEFLLGGKFGIEAAHLLDKSGNELADECLALAEEGVGIADSTAKDAADDVAGLGIRGKLAVGNGETDGTEMVGDDAHGHIHLFVLAVGEAAEFANLADVRLENVGIVVRVLALHDAHKTFESHTRVDDLCRQGLKRAVGLAVVLHEYEVPDFDNLGIILVHQVGTLDACSLAFLFGTAVDVDFGTWSTGTGVTHFPEIVVLVAVDDMVCGEEFLPVCSGLVVALKTFFGGTFENGDIEMGGVDMKDVDKETVGPLYGLLLEIVTERPVAKHLEHGVVIGVVSHFFQVVVLAGNAQTFLAVGLTTAFGFGISENDVLELIHSGIGEHERRVVLDDHRGRRYDEVTLLLEKLYERFADFVGCHYT